MQEPDTGEMIAVDPPIAMEAEQHGFCVLSIGEKIDIKGGEFKVNTIGRKKIIFECPENINELGIKQYEKITIKNGNFVVDHLGKTFLFARGLPGNRIVDQQVLDDFRKLQIKQMQRTKE
jgi:hypothetical protein